MPEAHDDALIAALIRKLPAPGTMCPPWPLSARINWLRMLVMAFNEAYGMAEPIIVSDMALPEPTARAPLRLVPVDKGEPAAAPAPDSGAPRYVVDREGFAMLGVKPIAPGDIPAGAILWDERAAGEQGDLETILWKGVGALTRDKLPKLDLRAA